MNGTWQAHLQGADARHKLGTVVYLGAGEGQRLAPVLALGAERIVLVEPLLEATMELKARIATDPRCVLYPLAISDQEGQAPLHVFNLPDLSSLSPPGALTELFPGLRETGQRTVETRTLTSLLADLGLSGEGETRHILHLDSPGSEARILSQLGRDDTPFEFISLRCGAQPLYGATDSADDLVGMIEALGYRLEACNSDDPDFPEYWMSLDHQARALSALKEKLSRAEESLAVLGDERTGLAQQLTQSQDALTQAKERIAELETFVREGRQTASQQSAQMAEVREKLKGAEKTLEVVKREKGEIETRLTQANERIETLQADLKTQASHRATLEAERDKARDALGTSLRLQALQAGDLKDLQTKYQTLLEEKQSQDRLLQTITSRMSDAIGQLGTVAPKTGAAKTQAAKKPASRSGKAKSSPAKKGPRA